MRWTSSTDRDSTWSAASQSRPPVDMSSLAQMAYDGTLNAGQIALTPLLFTSFEQIYPNFPIAQFLHGKALELRYSAIGCTLDAQRLRIQVTADDVKPDTQQDANMLRDMLRAQALPKRPLTAPLLVINGLDDPLVLPVWVSTAIARSCRLGGQIAHYPVPDGGHSNLLADQKFVEDWAADRFADKPAPSNCPRDTEEVVRSTARGGVAGRPRLRRVRFGWCVAPSRR